MLRKVTVEASFAGVLPVGSYANMRPGFLARMEFEQDFKDESEVGLVIESSQQELQTICYQNFQSEANRARVMKIQEDRKDFRFYTLPNGEEVPSVTSILNYDSDFLMDEGELKQYASQGNIIHAQVAEFIKTGLWKLPQDIEGIASDLFILKSGSLKLSLDGWDFTAFLKKYPMEKMENGETVFDEKNRFAGTPDGFSIVGGIKTIFDIKRTPEKVKNFSQMAAYAKASGRDVQQMMIIPLNDKTEQGFSKPIISTDIEKYFELFLYKRRDFKKVYGI